MKALYKVSTKTYQDHYVWADGYDHAVDLAQQNHFDNFNPVKIDSDNDITVKNFEPLQIRSVEKIAEKVIQ